MKHFLLFMVLCGASSPLWAVLPLPSSQNCTLTTHDGKNLTARFLFFADQQWLSASYEGGDWSLKFAKDGSMTIYHNGNLYDALALRQSVLADIERMVDSVGEMQLYMPDTQWWVKHFTRRAQKGAQTLPHELIDGVEISLIPDESQKNRNSFALSFAVMSHKDRLSLPVRIVDSDSAVTRPLPIALHFPEEQKSGLQTKVEWWDKPYAIKSVKWWRDKKENVVQCPKPIYDAKLKPPVVKRHAVPGDAQTNFLQLVHSSAVLGLLRKMIQSTPEKNMSPKEQLLLRLLTGVCAKHLAAVQKQIEKLPSTSTQTTDREQMLAAIGQEFGIAVSIEYRSYLALLVGEVQKGEMIKRFQSHCGGPLDHLLKQHIAPSSAINLQEKL